MTGPAGNSVSLGFALGNIEGLGPTKLTGFELCTCKLFLTFLSPSFNLYKQPSSQGLFPGLGEAKKALFPPPNPPPPPSPKPGKRLWERSCLYNSRGLDATTRAEHFQCVRILGETRGVIRSFLYVGWCHFTRSRKAPHIMTKTQHI